MRTIAPSKSLQMYVGGWGMDPMNTPDHSDALPVMSSGCNRLRSARAPCSAPLLSSKHTELLRALTAYSSASMSTGRPRGHHDHSQRLEVALVYYRRRGVKALPSGLQRPSASVTAVCWWRLAGSTAPYDSSHKGKSGPPSRPPPLSLGSVHQLTKTQATVHKATDPNRLAAVDVCNAHATAWDAKSAHI